MKRILIISILILAACGKAGITAQPAADSCPQTNLAQRGWGFNNPGGFSPVLNDCGNGTAKFTTSGVTTQGVPASNSATNGMVFNALGLCAGQPGATRPPNFSEIYFVFGQISTTWFTSTTNGVEDLGQITDGNIYTISNPGYSCKVSFMNGVATYH